MTAIHPKAKLVNQAKQSNPSSQKAGPNIYRLLKKKKVMLLLLYSVLDTHMLLSHSSWSRSQFVKQYQSIIQQSKQVFYALRQSSLQWPPSEQKQPKEWYKKVLLSSRIREPELPAGKPINVSPSNRQAINKLPRAAAKQVMCTKITQRHMCKHTPKPPELPTQFLSRHSKRSKHSNQKNNLPTRRPRNQPPKSQDHPP